MMSDLIDTIIANITMRADKKKASEPPKSMAMEPTALGPVTSMTTTDTVPDSNSKNPATEHKLGPNNKPGKQNGE